MFPTLIPRDLPHLARGLDWWKLVSDDGRPLLCPRLVADVQFDTQNSTSAPTKMNLLSAQEAREELL